MAGIIKSGSARRPGRVILAAVVKPKFGAAEDVAEINIVRGARGREGR